MPCGRPRSRRHSAPTSVVDIREADHARLEILMEELQPLVDELPAGDDYFDFFLSGGQHPRLWVDGTGNVIMARDRRTYRFVRETRLGRVTLAESTEPRVIAEAVTDYVAERIVERDQAFAVTDRQTVRAAPTAEKPAGHDRLSVMSANEKRSRSTDFVIAAVWMMIGIVVGAGVLFAIASYRGVVIG